ncbi:MAG: hypothetical protein A2Y40_06180 [Candidatus Margulisbacteria bacterium GWF2_35_9]|nr:MAG: hypothetical protein A2Y40_06180 [Candidatus Margulisbacteria bacterium GWF2_35_9]
MSIIFTDYKIIVVVFMLIVVFSPPVILAIWFFKSHGSRYFIGKTQIKNHPKKTKRHLNPLSRPLN